MAGQHEVEPGDCLVSIAHRHGFGDPRTIWTAPENAALKERRRDPHALAPGDVVALPDRDAKWEFCDSGRRYVFQRVQPRAILRLRLRDDDGTPFAGCKYRLVVGGDSLEGYTDAKGNVEKEVPPDAQDAELSVWLDEEDVQADVLIASLKLGHLPSEDTVGGLQSRLTSLGFACGEADGEMGPRTQAALKEFQKANGLPESGAADPATVERIRNAYEG